MVVQKPGMVERRLEYQGFAPWDGASTPIQRACGELLADDDVGRGPARADRLSRAALPHAATPVSRCPPFAVHPRRSKILRQASAEFLPVISAHRLVGNVRHDRVETRL